MSIIYKFLVILFYCIGDIACRINHELTFDIYQKAMKQSLKYDEKIGYWWWKLP